MLSKRSSDNKLPIIYVNAVGGQDDLVFDGGSMAVQANGTIAHEATRFMNQLLLATLDVNTGTFNTQAKAPLSLSRESEMYQALVVGLRDYVNNSGFTGVIIGLSGGIDSALTLCIAVDALGADKVYAVMMPYEYTSKNQLRGCPSTSASLECFLYCLPYF